MTTTSRTLNQLEGPINAKGPIETLQAQKAKLQEALRWADGQVEFTSHKARKAQEHRERIIKDLKLTEHILSEYESPAPEDIPRSFTDRLRATGSVVADDDAL